MQNASFRFSMLCTCGCLLLMLSGSEDKGGDRNRGDLYLTLLPPEIPPVHLFALPGWTPGPGNFHYGTAEGHSRRAGQKEGTVKC